MNVLFDIIIKVCVATFALILTSGLVIVFIVAIREAIRERRR